MPSLGARMEVSIFVLVAIFFVVNASESLNLKGRKSMTNLMSEKIKIQANIKSEVGKVWEYYTQPEHIVNWNFASDDWCCPRAENDLQVGGRYTARMEAKDGSFGFDFEGVYTEMKPMRSFSYKLENGREVTVDFNPDNSTTQVHVAFDPESQNPVEMQRDGWQAILNNFKKYVEQNS